jgi:ELWxxDGT repeat protein
MFRLSSQWLKSLANVVQQGQTGAARKAHKRARCSLGVEALEDRTLLSGLPQMLLDINPGSAASGASSFTACGSLTFFVANDGAHGNELWKTDGTTSGTTMVSDINPGSGCSSPTSLTNVNGTLYFAANDGTHGTELWKSDGTAAGTVLVSDINPGSANAAPAGLTNVNGTLFFSANDGTHGNELWKSDGTTAGTVMVSDINSGSSSSSPANLTNVNGMLLFSANDGSHGTELWKSDGTTAGTVMVSDINPGSSSSFVGSSFFTNVNGTLSFVANDGTHGIELWKSDGTSAGTVMVSDINPGSATSSPGFLTNVNGTLFFRAVDASHGVELWKSDGTSAGTVMVADINAGGAGSSPSDLIALNSNLLFYANDGTHGWELWTSDGTSVGTQLIKDINPGSGNSCPTYTSGLLAGLPAPNYAANVNGIVYFEATDGSSGLELWQTDGTAAGTKRVMDINPGSADSAPTGMTNVNGTLYFAANDGVHGVEPWILAQGPSFSVQGPATSTAGSSFSLTVTALDASGNLNPNYTGTVHFTSSDPSAILPADYTFTAGDQGLHTFTVTLDKAGGQSVTVVDTSNGSIAGTTSVSLSAAAVSSFTATGFPSPTTAGNAGNITITALDAYGNIATGYTGTVHFTSSDAQAALPADYTFTSGDAGVHVFSTTLKTAGTQSITATDTANSSLTSTDAGIFVNAAAASILVVSGPSSVTAGVAFSISVTAKDAYGNVATSYRGTVHFTSTDSKAKLPANYTFTAADNGTHTFSGLVLKTKGNQTISITDTVNSSIAASILLNVK